MTTTNTIAEHPTCASPALTRLISAVRAVVQSETDCGRVGLAVADLLQPYLGFDDFLTAEQREPDPTKYRQHILHVEPDGSFSIVALVWLPGQTTCVHDHVSWCVVGVHKGEEHETVYQIAGGETDPHLRRTGHHFNPTGSVA